MGKPDFAATARSFLPPRLGGDEPVLPATGILGATVMPHVIYPHSALMQPALLIPLAWLTAGSDVMGALPNRFATALQRWALVLLVTALNVFLLVRVLGP